MSEPQAHYGDVSLAEALSRLAHEIRESRKVSAAQLTWFQQQVDQEKLNKKLEELAHRLEESIKRAKEEIMGKVDDAIKIFSEEVGTFATEIGNNVDKLVTLSIGIDTDVKWLKEKLAALPSDDLSDQAKNDLQAIKDRFSGLAQKTAVAAQLYQTLDEQTDSSQVPTPTPEPEARTNSNR